MIRQAATTIAIFLSLLIYAQESFSGIVENWNYGSAKIMGDNKTVVGNIDGKGAFNIPLKTAFLQELKKQREKEMPYMPDGLMGIPTLSNLFSCLGTALEVQNTNQAVGQLSLSNTYALKKTTKDRFSIATMVASSSQEFAKYRAYRGQITAVKGYSVDYYYVAEPAVINGKCERNRRYGKDKVQTTKNYKLNFKKGWNLVLFEIEDVFTDTAGNTHPKIINYKTIDKMPENLRYNIIVSTKKYH